MRKTGDRVSFAVASGGYKCQHQPGRFDWGTVLLNIPGEDDRANTILIALDSGHVIWREEVYVHDEWYYYEREAWMANAARVRERMLWGDDDG